MQKNAADKKEIKKQSHRVKEIDRQEQNDVKFLLSNIQGRRFLWKYLSKCGVYRTSFTGSSETFFKEGQRNVGLWILDDITRANPDAYLLMIKENKSGNNDDDNSGNEHSA
jgi:hypothetical protein